MKTLYTGTVPVLKTLYTGTVPVLKTLYTGTVPVLKTLCTGTGSNPLMSVHSGSVCLSECICVGGCVCVSVCVSVGLGEWAVKQREYLYYVLEKQTNRGSELR